MGVVNSKIEEDKALQLCRDRKRYIRQALDRRCSFADAHFSYIHSLKSTGIALRKFVEPEVPTESSLYTSTSATPEPPALTDKSASQFSNSSVTHSQNAGTSESFSPVPSPLASGQLHVNHMKSTRIFSKKIEEKPRIPVTVTLRASTTAEKNLVSQSEDNSSLDTPSPRPGTPPWDYFGLFHPIDNQFSFQDGRGISHDFDNVDDIRQLQEDEDMLGFGEGDRSSINERDDFGSEDDFDQTSSEPLVRVFENKNAVSEHQLPSDSSTIPSSKSIASEVRYQDGDNVMFSNGASEIDETPNITPLKASTSAAAFSFNPEVKENGHNIKLGAKDVLSCMKEIEKLFSKASECGTEVPRMLEANKVQFRPLFPEEIANKSKASAYLRACFACFTDEVPHPQVTARHEIKYLTWHRSVSLNSSSSRNLLGTTTKDGIEDLSNNVFSSIFVNSGGHASTLDRLLAWEKKLYDEVKASGVIRREYDIKLRLLRDQESRDELSQKDKTRAMVKDLHSRIRVAIHRIDSVSKRIEELRDNELQPQLEELIGGLSQMWAMMLDCHKSQFNIISTACSNGSTKASVHSETQRQVTILLEFELNLLSSSFMKWIAAHKSYLEAINGWLLRCVFPLKRQKSRKRQQQFSPRRDIAPPIYVTCRDWLLLLEKLPAKEVEDAIKDLVNLLKTQYMPHADKGHGNSNLSFSFLRKAGRPELGEDIHRNERPFDWSVNYDSLLSGLEVFLDRLDTFAEASVEMYETLQKSVHEARVAYETR